MIENDNGIFGNGMERVNFAALLPMGAPEQNQGDTIGDDGLLVCGVCGARKQTYIEVEGLIPRTAVTCMCKCEIAKKEAEEARRRLEKNADRIASLKRRGLSDAGMTAYTFDRDDRRDAKASDAARAYVEQFDVNFAENIGKIFIGDVGSGKTFLAGCIANALIEKGVFVLMTDLRSLISEMTRNFGEYREDVLSDVRKCKLLILDDFGTERETDYMNEQVYEIINERYKAKKPLVITTNLTPRQLTEENVIARRRVYDRVLEMCSGVLIHGGSRRKEIAREKGKIMRALLGLEDEA